MAKFDDVRDNIKRPITTLSKAIKAKCRDCTNNQQVEIDNCTIKKCPLYDFRKGRYAFKEKRGQNLTDEQKAKITERLQKAKGKSKEIA